MEFTGMEALLATGVACVIAAAVYFFSVIGIREKSFEEAIAEQKKRSDDLLGQHKSHKKKIPKDKNANKKLKKREKQQAEQSDDVEENNEENVTATAVASVGGKKKIEIVDEPEILDDEDQEEENQGGNEETNSKGKSQGNNRRPSIPSNPRRDSIIKPILLNKDETPAITANPISEPQNNFEQTHPKDDCELKQQEQTTASTPPSPHPSNNVNKSSGSNTPVDEVAAVTDSPGPKKSSRNVNKNRKNDDDVNSRNIEQLIDRLPLTSSEIQNLIDTLLNKQHAGDSDWVKNTKAGSAGNSAQELKRQLEAKDKMLEDEKASVRALQDKLKELRNEFSNEKTKLAAVRRSLEENVNARNLEVQNLQIRLRQLGEHGMSEKQELQKQLARMQVKFKDVQDEYEAIKSDYRNYRDAEQSIRTKADTLERESGALKTQCGHLENQLKNAFASNQEMSNQIRTLQEHLRANEERKKEAEFSYTSEFRKLQDREAVLLNELTVLKSSAAQLETENAGLRQSLQVSEQSAKSLDEVNGKYEETRKSEVSLKNVVNELKSNISALNEVVAEKDNRLSIVSEEVGVLKGKIAELEKNRESGESAAVVRLNEQVEKLSGEAEKLKSEVASGKAKNDELRVKNQKLVESLDVTEKSLQTRIEGSEKLVSAEASRKERAANLLSQILGKAPELSSDDWLINSLAAVESEVTELRNKPAIVVEKPAAPAAPVVDEAAVRKTKELEDEVTHYQTMLKQTEGLLSSLQASINEEESKWATQTAEKDKEIERLKTEVEDKKNIQDTSSQLEDLKKTNASLEDSLKAEKSRVESLTSELSTVKDRLTLLESHSTNGKMNGDDDQQQSIINPNNGKKESSSPVKSSPATPAAAAIAAVAAAATTPVTISPAADVTNSPPATKEKKKKKKNKANNH